MTPAERQQRWEEYYEDRMRASNERDGFEEGQRGAWTVKAVKKKLEEGGAFAFAEAEKTPEQQLAWLKKQQHLGLLRVGAPLDAAPWMGNDSLCLEWRTNVSYVPVHGEYGCYDAMLQVATGLSLEVRRLQKNSMHARTTHVHANPHRWQVLGVKPLPPTANKNLPFSVMNARFASSELLGSLFFWKKPYRGSEARTSLRDLFYRTHGVFGIHCKVYHREDVDFEFAEGIPHYMTFNADTRYLNIYPHVRMHP